MIYKTIKKFKIYFQKIKFIFIMKEMMIINLKLEKKVTIIKKLIIK